MPLTYSIDKPARIVTIHYDRNPPFEEFERTMDRLFRDSNYEAGFKLLLDRHLVKEPPSTGYIKKAVEFLRKHEDKLDYLAVVVKDTASYGMERMAQLLASDIDINFDVFTDIEEAKQWLRSSN